MNKTILALILAVVGCNGPESYDSPNVPRSSDNAADVACVRPTGPITLTCVTSTGYADCNCNSVPDIHITGVVDNLTVNSPWMYQSSMVDPTDVCAYDILVTLANSSMVAAVIRNDGARGAYLPGTEECEVTFSVK